MKEEKIIYTKTDEAPALATVSFLPIIKKFTAAAGINVEIRDISLAGRILAVFPEYLDEKQKTSDALTELSHLIKEPHANVIKLPNISASIPQLKAAIQELQSKGYKIPDYPDEPAGSKEKEIKECYDKIKGSAVNPVLREGNSDRRAPKAVKEYAKNHPHSMGEWKADSKTHVASMSDGDFYESELAVEMAKDDNLKIELVSENKKSTVLKESLPVLKGEIVDSAVMNKNKLETFLEEQIEDAKTKDVLFSIHLKATMMKVSDPIIFGHAVSVFLKDLFAKYNDTFLKLGVNPNNGIGDLVQKVSALPAGESEAILKNLDSILAGKCSLAMVNSDKGITNLHVPSDIIIDASMPAAIRIGGRMWNAQGETQDMKAVIPDRSYAGVYQSTIDYCKKHGAFNPAAMGSVSNVGLMAQKAEEYGSHDTTFEIPEKGTIKIKDQAGKVLMEQMVEKGDIFRMSMVKDAPVQDWIKLAIKRAREAGTPAVFWLDEKRAHDRQLIKKVEKYLKEHNTSGLEIKTMAPAKATTYSLERCSAGKDTISVTGNVLRDYLTDLFPILELGTSAKMLSIVPLMNGGALFETGAGGSAPKHVQQLVKENHLRWDSLGEFLALAVSLEHLSKTFDNQKALILSKTLDQAIGKYLENNKAPSRKCGEIDNRGSHFYVTLYWAEALAAQTENADIKNKFTQVAQELNSKEKIIANELLAVQGSPVDMGGYYFADDTVLTRIMRPSETFNKILELL